MMTDSTHKLQKTIIPDEVLTIVADYVCNPPTFSEETYKTAAFCLADTLGCGILALSYPACTKLLGPISPGTIVPKGCHVPGTDYILDPVRGAFNIGTMIRWLDYNDTWLAAEWGHPSDNLGALLALTDYLTRQGSNTFTVRDLLTAMIKAHEIQGNLALFNSFNRIGFDHVIFVKVASAAVSAHLLGASHSQIIDTLSNAWIDLGPLRTYRHAPNTGSRKSWAAGDATSRGVQLAMMVMQGEMGYPHALTAPKWGLYDVLFQGNPFKLRYPLASYVMDNVLFKISYPAEFHAQTAVECAVELHPLIKDRIDDISMIAIETHESAIRIIDKTGVLNNPADRDHCLQYMIAVGLLTGNLTANDYEDEAASNPLLDKLRSRMSVQEYKPYTTAYLDPEKRSIANAITIHFKDGTQTKRVSVEYPLGHPRRREEGIPCLLQKFTNNLATHFPKEKVDSIIRLFGNHSRLNSLTVPELVNFF